jgi:hypothetical protein
MRTTDEFSDCLLVSDSPLIRYMSPTIIILSLVVIALVSHRVGFVSPDSWNYLRLAESILNGTGCSVGGEYFAAFPCGYPAFISATSWLTGLDVFSASKLFNILALALSGFFFYKATSNFLLAFLLIINPVTLAIGHYTWSENAFLLSVSLIFYSATTAFNGSGSLNISLSIVVGLLIGLSSRYYFGPYAFFMFLSIWLIYGKNVAIKLLPYFIFAGFLFIGYYIFNKISTGYGTGLPRISSPESLLFLIIYFLKYSIEQLIIYASSVFPLILLLIFSVFMKKKQKSSIVNISERYAPLTLMIVLGVAYIVLSFTLRVYSHFDLYGYRTVGYGFVFLISGILAFIFYYFQIVFSWRGILALIGVSVISIALSQRGTYLVLLSDSTENNNDITFHNAIDRYDSGISFAGVIVPFSVPSPKWSVSANLDLFYQGEVETIVPYTAPYRVKESYDDFKKRILSHGGECRYDFTRLTDKYELKEALSSQYTVDVSFEESFFRPRVIKNYRYHSSLSYNILEKFSPGKLVDCGF